MQKLLKENSRFPSARSMVPDPQLPVSVTTLHAPSPTTQAPRGLPSDKRREIESVLGELKALRELLRQSGISRPFRALFRQNLTLDVQNPYFARGFHRNCKEDRP